MEKSKKMTSGGLAITDIVDYDNSIITIYSNINESMARAVSSGLTELDKYKKSILIKINSYGGSMTSTIAICNEIMTCDNHVFINITGVAYSGAAMISLAGDGTVMSKSGNLMFHNPSWIDSGKLEEHDYEVKCTKELWTRFCKTLFERRERNINFKEFMKKMTGPDWFINPSQALKLGLIDEVY